MHIKKAPGVGTVLAHILRLVGIIAMVPVGIRALILSPHEYAVVVPARQAYSHCASVGNT
jgi:hypothetical protein